MQLQSVVSPFVFEVCLIQTIQLLKLDSLDSNGGHQLSEQICQLFQIKKRKKKIIS